jgi:hypothetical protein
MKKGNSLKKRAAILAAALVIPGLVGAAILAAASPQEAVTLIYKFTPGTPLSYKTTGSNVQNIDAMGQTMTNETASGMDFTLMSKGLKDGNHLLGLKIDNMTLSINGPQGGVTPNLSGIIGKSVDIVLSPRGETVDVSGAAALSIDMGEGGVRDMTSDFQGLFDTLPDHAVKIGDSWPSQKKITQKSTAGDVNIVLAIANTLDGFETIDGRSCARIKANINGTMSGALNQGGMALGLEGKMTGTMTWYFAVKDGVFIKSDSTSDLGGTISVEAAGMTLGFSGQQKSVMALVKK